MADAAPKTEKWTARENLHKPEGLHLIVSGNVLVADADREPVLTKGQALDPKLLPLELTIVTCGDPSIAVEVWKGAKYHEVVTADQYNRVQVSWDGQAFADFPVLNDREHATLMTKQAKVQNSAVAAVSKAKTAKDSPSTTKEKIKKVVKKVSGEKAAKTSAKKVAKKAAKKTTKQAAPKKTVKKTVKKTAKKTAKKAAPKKSAKKAAKTSSTLKKLVKKLVKTLTPAKKTKKKSKKKR
jgi:hypothetical protein